MTHKEATLDEAWAVAEAALPQWWRIRTITRLSDDLWEAVAYESKRIEIGRGRTPAAALQALAAAFRKAVPPNDREDSDESQGGGSEWRHPFLGVASLRERWNPDAVPRPEQPPSPRARKRPGT